jgi:hypothetical protein
MTAFRLVEQIFERLATGEVEVINGMTCFRDRTASKQEWCVIPDALDGWVRLWRRLVDHYRLVINLQPVETIAFLLASDRPLTEDDVADARRVVAQCRAAYRSMDIYTVSVLRDAVLKTLRAEREQQEGLAA